MVCSLILTQLENENENGRRPHFFLKKMTSIFGNGRQPKNIMQPKTMKSKNNGCGTAPGNLVLIFIQNLSLITLNNFYLKILYLESIFV